jgi:hypothetical protein
VDRRRQRRQSVYLFDRASGRLLRRAGGLPHVVNRLAFSPDGKRLAAALGGSNGVRLIDPATGRVAAEDRDYGGDSYGAAFDRAGRLATTSYDGKVRLYGPDLRLLRSAPAPGGERPFGVAFSPDGAQLAVGYADTAAVDVLDAAALGRLFAADTGGVDNGTLAMVAWSADGSALLAAGRWQLGGEYRAGAGPGAGGARTDLPLAGTRSWACAGCRAGGWLRRRRPAARGAGRGRGARPGRAGRPRPTTATRKTCLRPRRRGAGRVRLRAVRARAGHVLARGAAARGRAGARLGWPRARIAAPGSRSRAGKAPASRR